MMQLSDISQLSRRARQSQFGFAEFRSYPEIADVDWPDDVIEHWLYDHGTNGSFLDDYRDLDLRRVLWAVEVVPVQEFLDMPTGPSDTGYIDEIALDPDHWIRSRDQGIHIGVSQCWNAHGTWKRWPVLLDRQLLINEEHGLQVVEGRTRVGVLRGRHRLGQRTAEQHLAWVGRGARRSG